jgi:hypothetical protein
MRLYIFIFKKGIIILDEKITVQKQVKFIDYYPSLCSPHIFVGKIRFGHIGSI